MIAGLKTQRRVLLTGTPIQVHILLVFTDNLLSHRSS